MQKQQNDSVGSDFSEILEKTVEIFGIMYYNIKESYSFDKGLAPVMGRGKSRHLPTHIQQEVACLSYYTG